MYNRITLVALLVLLIFHEVIDGKKVRRKRPKAEDEDLVPQPNVLTYSNFGFNDVGSYDGFVPTSPDYATFLTAHGGKEESTTRLYGPAFPTAMESTGFSSGYGSHLPNSQSFNTGSDGQQLGLYHLQPNSMNTFSFTKVDAHEENKFSVPDQNSGGNSEKYKMPVYGAKINLKNKSKTYDEFNDTGFTSFNGETTTFIPTDKGNEKFHKIKRGRPTHDSKQTFTESSKQSNAFNNMPNYPISSVDTFPKTPFNYSSSLLNFPRVVDFTNLKPLYQTDLGANYPKLNTINKPFTNTNPITTTGSDVIHTDNYNENGDKYFKISPGFKNTFEFKDENSSKKRPALHTDSNDEDFINLSSNKYKGVVTDVEYKDNKYKGVVTDAEYKDNKYKGVVSDVEYRDGKYKGVIPDFEYKDKVKGKPWKNSPNNIPNISETSVTSTKYGNNNDEYKQTKNSMKGYEYSTNHSSTSFKYDVVDPKKPFNNNIDEIIPASSNIDAPEYQFPNTEFLNYNKIPKWKPQYEEYSDFSFQSQDQHKHSEDYLNKFKNLYTTTPSTTSNWGNIFKTSEFSSYKNQKRRPSYTEDNNNDEIIHIPKRPPPTKYETHETESDDKPNDWSFYNNYYRPHKSYKPQYDWNKDITSTRFKSEEDLLGLRTRDTLHSSYLPFGSATSDPSDDSEYKKLTNKWRTDYLKAKQKDAFHEYESYASDSKPIHVPVPKPYPIEVPQPVIIPVPQPYPVRVPVPKPVAVPVVQELMVPIVKPVPYPVIKKVPYPIEKPVPVPVEKQVQVPVMKPYPVAVPQIRPVFHHSKHRDEYNNLDHDEESDWPRPDSSKRVPYSKRPKTSRNRHRRPSRMTYHDRSRRRWPQHQESKDRRYSGHSKRHSTASMEFPYPRYRHRNTEFDAYEHENSGQFGLPQKYW